MGSSAKSTQVVLGIVTLGVLAAVPEVLAQQLEEVVVTAQRREEGVQNIPVAVSAFSADTLQKAGVTEALDIAKIVPNFVAHNNTGLGTANTYAIRGLNNTESIATFDPPVGTYVGDYFIQRQNANNYALFDINRVEVLRGPQGTLFGRNTTGGAVRMILNDPAPEFGGYLEVGAGRFGRTQIRGSIDYPIADTFRTKVSAYYVEDNGFVDNPTTGENDLNREDNFGVRAHVQWDISPTVTWDGSATVVRSDHANIFNSIEGNGRISNTGLVQEGSPLSGQIVGDKQSFPLGNETDSAHLTTDLTFDLNNAELTVMASYLALDQDFLLDFFDGAFNSGGFTIANAGEHDQFSLEAKLTGTLFDDQLDYVAGVFYFTEDNETDLAQIFNLGAIGLAPPPVGLPLIQYDRILDNTVDSWALYAQADWHFNEQATLTLGLRYTDEEKDIGLRDNGNPAAGAVINSADLVAAGIPLVQTESILTPRIAFEYQFTDDIMAYASATRGFKSGGWNARGTVTSTLQPFSAERVWNYEGGLRSEFLDNSLRFNANVFFTDVSDFQLPSAFTDPDNGSITFITQNSADLEVAGAEFEILALPTDNLTVFANIGFLDSEYTNLDPSIVAQQTECRTLGTSCAQSIVDTNGDIADPTRAPDTQISVGGWFDFDIGSDTIITPRATAVRYGDHNVSTAGQDIALIDPYTVLNAGVALTNTAQNWSLTASCKNCTDRDQVVALLAGFLYVQDPMTWSLTFNKTF
ncbi:MAG: TonB-dependent receptor [Gammaproteobacteria bacterium]